MFKVPKKWTAGVENPEELEKKLIEQDVLFKRLYEILDVMETTNYKERLLKSNYDKMSWSEFQADLIGYARCLQDIKSLLKFTQD